MAWGKKAPPKSLSFAIRLRKRLPDGSKVKRDSYQGDLSLW